MWPAQTVAAAGKNKVLDLDGLRQERLQPLLLRPDLDNL
jgi:hypothetical protein